MRQIPLGQSATAVGTTSAISTSMKLDDAAVTSAKLTVPVATVKSAKSLCKIRFEPESWMLPSIPMLFSRCSDLSRHPAFGRNGDQHHIHRRLHGDSDRDERLHTYHFANWNIQYPTGPRLKGEARELWIFCSFLAH